MSGQRVLAIDDDPVMTELLRLQLCGAGFEVTTLQSSGAALSAMRGNPPDMLVLDLNMPGMCGLEVLARMQADAALRQVKVLLLTGEDDATFIARALRLGAAAYLIKPFTTLQLLERIDAMRGRPAGAAGTQGPVAVAAPVRAAPRQTGALNPVVETLMGTYGAKTVGRLLTSLAGQLGRLEDRAGAPQAQIAQDAHAIKGAAASLGFTAVSASCAALERACAGGGAVERALLEAALACDFARQQIAAHLRAA